MRGVLAHANSALAFTMALLIGGTSGTVAVEELQRWMKRPVVVCSIIPYTSETSEIFRDRSHVSEGSRSEFARGFPSRAMGHAAKARASGDPCTPRASWR